MINKKFNWIETKDNKIWRCKWNGLELEVNVLPLKWTWEVSIGYGGSSGYIKSAGLTNSYKEAMRQAEDMAKFMCRKEERED